VKKAFVRLARIHHPDKGGSAERFRRVREAYEVLRDGVNAQAPPAAASDNVRFTGSSMFCAWEDYKRAFFGPPQYETARAWGGGGYVDEPEDPPWTRDTPWKAYDDMFDDRCYA
jgi:curved DNA-binding protein CbpA